MIISIDSRIAVPAG
ncbi:hypothetical protein YPPY92_4885, partial [Yersinia pestis PY-92]